jgi:hypothetical protein
VENKNYRILNLEGSWLENNKNDFIYSTIDKKTNKIYTATMPYSLETIRAFSLLPKEVIKIGKDNGTKLFVNFKFTKDYIDDSEKDDIRTKINKKKLRKLIYTSKVIIDDIEYCFFKRGASKARTANVIFVKKEYYNNLFNPCLLGLHFVENEKYDITSMQAYISLIMSGIIDTIKIQKDEILIINDIMSPSFLAKQSLTKMNENNEVKQYIDTYEVSNNITDGQVLLDESLFIGNVLSTATTALLRNDFFKGNACRTKLQQFWNGERVWDMYRGWMDSKKIKLVITPSACKYLKFANQFNNEEKCFLDWLDKIPTTFGIVKVDHIGNYEYSNRLSYQMLNSMDFNKEEVKILVQDELDYLKLLKDNTLKTNLEIKKMTKDNKKINREERNKMTYFLNLVMNNNDNDDILSTGDMISDLLNVNSNFRYTTKFKEWKSKQIQDYINTLRLGKIRIKNSLYAIMVSCPYEMLVATTKENNIINECILGGWEIYCPRFKDGENLMQIRNPQVNAGNIASVVNKYHEEYKLFGYWKDDKPQFNFVVFVNSWNVDNMNRLQGCDWDVDSCYLTNNKLLSQKAQENQIWETPTNGIKGNKGLRIYNNKSLADLDNYLGGSTMSIGKIINKSAIFNAYMYHAINNNYSQEYINACYNASSTLSSFSQIAIDMAKKNFEGLSLSKEMINLNKTSYINSDGKVNQILRYEKAETQITILEYITNYIQNQKKCIDKFKLVDKIDVTKLVNEYNKFLNVKSGNKDIKLHKKFNKKIRVLIDMMVVPYFFTYVAKDNSFRIPTKMNCAMDYLEEIIDDFDTKAIGTDKVNIKDLFCLQKQLMGRNFCVNKIDEVRKIIGDCESQLNRNNYDKCDSKEEYKRKRNLRKWIKQVAVNGQDIKKDNNKIHKNGLKDLKLNPKTIHRILLRAFNLDIGYKGYKIIKLNKDKQEIKNKNGEVILYKELNEMTFTVLTLIYNSYPKDFLNCFKDGKIDVEIIHFWE